MVNTLTPLVAICAHDSEKIFRKIRRTVDKIESCSLLVTIYIDDNCQGNVLCQCLCISKESLRGNTRLVTTSPIVRGTMEQ